MKIKISTIFVVCGVFALGLLLMELLIQNTLLQRPERQIVYEALIKDAYMRDNFGNNFVLAPEDVGSSMQYNSNGSLNGTYMFILNSSKGEFSLKVNWYIGSERELMKMDVFKIETPAKETLLFSREFEVQE